MKHKPPVPLKCVTCGCTDDNACILPNGQPCSWATVNPPMCTACAQQNLLFGSDQAGALGAIADNNADAFDAPARRRRA